MSDQMTLSAPTDRHPDFEHVALYHEGADDLAARVAPDIAAALDAGDAVLVRSPQPVRERLAAELGRASAKVEFVADDVRHHHPNVAMSILHDFVRSRTRHGARRAWSIGAVPLDGNAARNADWIRYERAVNEVLKHLPLRAVCTYDLATTPTELLAEARGAHLDGDAWCGPAGEGLVPPTALPTGDPLLRVDVQAPRAARHTITEAYAELITDDALGELTLIVSEIVSNALSHGAPPVTLSAWYDTINLSSVIDVSDHGRGIDDPFVDLRPPKQRPGGAGMWIVGQLSERVTSQRIDGVHHVTVTLQHASTTL